MLCCKCHCIEPTLELRSRLCPGVMLCSDPAHFGLRLCLVKLSVTCNSDTTMAKTNLQWYFLAAGSAFLAVSCGLVYREVVCENTVEYRGYITYAFWMIVTALPILLTCLLALICFDIFCVRSSQYFTVGGLLLTHILQRVMMFSAIFLKRKLLKLLLDPRGAQETLLKEWMVLNADSAYGRRYQFRQIRSLQDLKDKHPLTDYSHYEKYVERMANGEQNVLICEELDRFGITSGTTGKGKLIPLTKSRRTNLMSTSAITFSEANRTFGGKSPLIKGTILYVNPRPHKTPSGHLVGPMNLQTDDMKIMGTMFTTPWEAREISTEFEALYIGILFSLRDRDVGIFIGPFCFTVCKAMALIENNWRKLVIDIEIGAVDKGLVISEGVRTACENALSADPKRAAELRQEFEKGFEGIMRRIWPHLKYIIGVDTANFTEKLQTSYAKGTPIYPPMYTSTEGDFGINLWPGEKPRYVLLPNSVLYEFIPEKKMSDKAPTTLFIDEVKRGQNYEMVVSTLSGFYRYRFGDVIKVVDFYQNTPVVEFMYRSGQLLNLRAEKVTEISVDEAIHHMISNIPGASLNHWTSAESSLLTKIRDNDEFDKSVQFYLIFVELEGDNDVHSVLGSVYEQQIDNSLKERNNYYDGYRKAGTISAPRVFFVKPGSFTLLQDLIVTNTSASYNQFKMPRKLKTRETLELMLKQQIS